MSKMRRQRRHLGMTVNQLIILGCLSLTAVAAIFGSFIFISSSGAPGPLALLPTAGGNSPVQPTDVPNFPEETVVIPTATLPILLEPGIPADWESHNAETVEITLPPQFEPEIAEIERQERIIMHRSQGYEFLAARLEQPFDYRFWFNYPQPESVAYDTHIFVRADVLPTLTLDEYLEDVYSADLQGFEPADRQKFEIANLEAQRIILDANLNDLRIRTVDYVITDEINLWIITCSATLEEFETWLPVFDRIASSFRLLY